MTTTSIALLIIAGASIGFAAFCYVMYLVDRFGNKKHKM